MSGVYYVCVAALITLVGTGTALLLACTNFVILTFCALALDSIGYTTATIVEPIARTIFS
jgi:hypothetical protein